MQIKQQKLRGFTLIEILLVIAIMAIILSLSLVFMRNKAEGARINKAALEMQNVLQAALTFVSSTGQWPTNYACNTTAQPASDFLSYLPNNDYQSSFGANYCWARDGSTQRFWVALPLAGANYRLAQQIAALLPNAYAIKDPNTTFPKTNSCDGTEPTCYVRSEVTQSSIMAQGGIAGAGYCVSQNQGSAIPGSASTVSCTYQGTTSKQVNYQIRFPCPAGQGNVVLIPNFLNMGWPAKKSGNGSPSNVLYDLRPGYPNCVTNNGIATCSVSILATTTNQDQVTGETLSVTNPEPGGIAGTVGASYVGYCYL